MCARRLVPLCFLGLLAFSSLPAAPPVAPSAGEGKKKKTPERRGLVVPSWLVLGPAPESLPLFHGETPGGYGIEQLLQDERYPRFSFAPEAGAETSWFGGRRLRWQARAADAKGLVRLEPPGERKHPAIAWLASYIRRDRFGTLDLELLGGHPRRAWLDGEPVVQGGLAAEEDRPAEVKGKIKLTSGKHLLLVQTVYDPERGGVWVAGATLSAEKDEPVPEVDVSADPVRDLDILDVLDLPHITSVAVSPDGSEAAATLSRVWPGTDDAETWIEVRSTRDGALRWTWRGSVEAGQVAFAPVGRRLSYVGRESKDGKDSKDVKELLTLWMADLDRGTAEALVERVENLAGYVWSPAGDAVAYWATRKAEPDKRGVKRLEGLLDRQATYRNKDYLHLVRIEGRARRPLTAGSASAAGPVFSPDGARLLFHREIEDLAARPYSRKEIWEIDLRTFEARHLRDSGWLGSAQYAPDGRRLLILSGPSEFGVLGVNVPEGLVANESDGELYVWDPATGEAEALTREFDPSVEAVVWSRADGNIYAKAQDQDRVRLFRYDAAARRFEPLDVGFEVLQDLVLAERAPVAVATGTSPWTPEVLAAVDLRTGRAVALARPAESYLSRVRRGAVEPWSFVTPRGKTLTGRAYLPPGFDAGRRYPGIVYYYGGTSPVPRDFGGRYPKEWWASQGYVVYVLQPSGATGFGQAHSALHVNDWGAITSDEILEGARRFLEAHPYVDPKRVGCIGASFGGFMTMLLVTKSDLFAAAVSHAGISSISSYWGEGYWGYSYNALAAAGSFPWNRKDIYVDRSPLFRADKAKTPILLTHGVSDTNVPVGESDTFYTALKLVGAPVEYVQVEGQDHWIADHAKRALWSRTIVAWFDRWLKGQPEWWEDLHPQRK